MIPSYLWRSRNVIERGDDAVSVTFDGRRVDIATSSADAALGSVPG